MARKKSGSSVGMDVLLFFLTGGLWLIVIIIRAVSKPSPKKIQKPPQSWRSVDIRLAASNRPAYPAVPLDKASKIVSITTDKWFKAAQREFVVMDLETTGLEKSWDAIVEVSALRYINGQRVGSYTSLVNPGFPIPREAIAVHHITDAMVRQAPPIDVVLPELLQFLGSSLLVGHNANFDIGFIEVWARRLGYNPTWNYIDTISVARKAFPGLDNYRQSTVLAAIGYKQEAYHRAEDDCQGCAQILLLAMKKQMMLKTTGSALSV